jgi:diguanylate cyclase (GGDEF)-like protein
VAVEDLTWAVGELAELSTQEFDVDQLLRRLCEVAVQALAVDGVGVMRTDPNSATRFVHASDPPLARLEQLQETLQEGPCRDAVATRGVITAGSIADMQWSAFQDLATDLGVQAVLALPMISSGRTFGTLDLFWRSPHQPDTEDRAAAQLLANVAASYLAMIQDRAQARHAEAQLIHRALHDQLTGLPNRSLMQELIQHALIASTRKGTLVAVLFIDLDRFKPVNDTYGHQVGDEVLQVLAHRMRGAVRSGDIVGRLSGDEFLVLCDDLAARRDPLENLNRLGHRIRQCIAEPLQLPGVTVPIQVTASIGVAVTADNPTAAELIRSADLAMYEAKTIGGRDDVVVIQHR